MFISHEASKQPYIWYIMNNHVYLYLIYDETKVYAKLDTTLGAKVDSDWVKYEDNWTLKL